MKYLILISVFIVTFAQKWEPYKVLWYNPDRTITSKASYIDKGSGMLHIIFVEEIFERYDLHEARVNSEMKAEKVSKLMQDVCIVSSVGAVSIDGAGNGKDVYVIASGKQNAGYDLFFIESHDGGDSWSEAVIPRKDGLRDDHYRGLPRLVVDSSGKIWIVYKRDRYGFAYVTRKPGSTIWEEEQEIPHPKCSPSRDLEYIRVNAVAKSKSQDTILLSYRCPNDNQLIISETEDGINWRHYDDAIFKDYYAQEFYTSYNSQTKRIFISRESKGFNSEFEICWLFEYQLGGKKIKLSLDNGHYIHQGIVEQVYESGEWFLIYLIYPFFIDSNDKIKSVKINMDKPWISTPFPVPDLGYKIYKMEFRSYSSYLFAEGIDDKHAISVARYKF